MKFKSDIEVQAGLRDSSGAIGSSGQILSSTGTNVSWVNQSTIANDVQNQVKAGVAINKGQAVYVTGADGTNIIVGLASNASEATSSKTLGLLDATVAINGFANVVQIGRLSGLNTLGATAGDPVWLGTGGNLIYGLIGKPYAPANLVFIGIVTRVNVSNGEIFVNVQNGFELNEIHDVDLKTTVPVNGDILGFNGTLWVNKTIAGWLGYTPANASGTVNYVSKFTGTTTLGNSSIFDNGNVGIGTITPEKKLDVNGGLIVGMQPAPFWNAKFKDYSDGSAIYISTVNGGGGKFIAGNAYYNNSLQWWSDKTTASAINLDNGAIVLYTNSGLTPNTNFTPSEKMRVTPGGNVGIGTTSPSQKLNIASDGYNFRLSNNTNASGYNIGRNVTDGLLYLYGDQTGYTGYVFSGIDGERMRILANGNVGIGTTSPSYKLQVNGGIYQQDTSFTSYYDGTVRFGGTNGYTTIITNAGNVGIGTSSPGTKLDVTNYARVLGSAGGSSGTPSSGKGLELTYNSTTNVGYIFGFNRDTIAATDISVGPTNSPLYIKANGDAGIGNTAPTQKLHVTGNARITGGIYDSANAIGTSGQVLSSTGTGTSWVTPTTGTITGSGTTNYVTKFTGTSAIGNSQLFDNGTSVGIGTATPTAKLDLYTNGDQTLRFSHPTSGTFPRTDRIVFGSPEIDGGSSAIYGVQTAATGAPGYLSFYTTSGGVSGERMRIISNGNVGIGTTAPSGKLSVFGGLTRLDNIGTQLVLGTQGVAGAYEFSVGTNNAFTISLSGVAERFQINSGGNIEFGKGLNSPKVFSFEADTTGVGNSLGGFQWKNIQWDGNIRASINAITDTALANGALIFSTGATNANATEKMRISSAGNVGIGTSSPTTKLEVTGVVNSYATMDNLARRFNSPEGASYITTTSSIVGAIKIKLPVAVNNSSTMMSFRVKVYQYSTGQTSEFQISGYNFSGGGWYSPSVTNLSDNNNSNFYVYFGTDATSDCIWIGETTSSWVYPQVFVTDFQAGFQGQDKAWATGWAISFVTSYDTIELSRYAAKVITSNNIGSFAISGSGTTNYVPKFTGATSLGNSLIYDNGTNVGINNTSPNYALDVIGSASISSNIYTNNVYGLSFGTVGYANSNTLINTYTGKDILFSVNSSERMRITSTGNVGIGTTSPSAKLDVNLGNINLSNAYYLSSRNNANTANINLIGRDTSDRVIIDADGYGTTVGGGGSVLINPTSGNVGIGTTSPSFKLDVVNNSGVLPTLRLGSALTSLYGGGGNILFAGGTSDYVSGEIKWANGTFTKAKIDYAALSGSMNIDSSATIIFTTASVERMRISSTGGVGIGTSNPSQFLHVQGNARITGSIYDSSNTAGTAGQVLSSTGTGTAWVTGGGGGISGSGTTNYIPLFTGSTSVGNSNIYYNTGNIGIGTTSPGASLDVQGTFNASNSGAALNVSSSQAYAGYQGNYDYSYAGASYSSINSNDGQAFIQSYSAAYARSPKLGIQAYNSNTGDQDFLVAKHLIQNSYTPSDPYTPAKWIRIWDEDTGAFFYMPMYQ